MTMMITLYKVLQEQEEEKYCGDYSDHVSYKEIEIGWYADKSEAEKKLEEVEKASKDYCFIKKILVPKEVVEEALKILASKQV